jgi:hypothetical protein
MTTRFSIYPLRLPVSIKTEADGWQQPMAPALTSTSPWQWPRRWRPAVQRITLPSAGGVLTGRRLTG